MPLIESIQNRSSQFVSSHKTELTAAAWITGIALTVIGIICLDLGTQGDSVFFHADPASYMHITLANGDRIWGAYEDGNVGMILLGALGGLTLGVVITIASAVLFFKYEERNKTNLLRMLVALAAVTIIGVGVGSFLGGLLTHAMQAHAPDSTTNMFVWDRHWSPLSNSELNDYRAVVASVQSEATRAIAVGATILATGGLALASVLYMGHRKRKGEATQAEERVLGAFYNLDAP